MSIREKLLLSPSAHHLDCCPAAGNLHKLTDEQRKAVSNVHWCARMRRVRFEACEIVLRQVVHFPGLLHRHLLQFCGRP
jgi:hypothetical protein